MRTSLDCISCWVRMALQASRLAGADEYTQRKIMLDVLQLLRNELGSDSPLRVAQQVQYCVEKHTGCADPYMHLKINCNEDAEKWSSQLRERVQVAEDPFFQALKVAVIGNCMDYGAFSTLDLEKWLSTLNQQGFSIDDSQKLKNTLRTATTLTYFADNTGEIVFDTILIEELLRQRSLKTVRLVIRERPFLNDVSSEDLVPDFLRNHADVEIIPFPIVKDRRHQLLWEAIMSSDIVISKGMANYENYSEHTGIYFLLIAKCDLVSSDLSRRTGMTVTPGDWVLFRS